ncbi:MAG: sigma 54-interacting transcriptional regulator, partial [Kofleriaceae bacterium]|nr:sigma 54-interacting transcriptional regulator [Kofleriaceae bacterium]
DKENYLVHITTGTHVWQICLYLLSESRHLPAKLLQSTPPKKNRSDAGDIVVIDLDLSRYDKLATRFREEKKESLDFLKSGIRTKNRAFNTMIEQIEKVSLLSTEPILLMGPTGAGKSQLARRIYDLRKTRSLVGGKFVSVNCATLRGDAAMSTLFGHVKGAYTGASKDRPGLMREADGGILFLDEIGELGLEEQAMLLRAVEEGVFHPVGSDKMVKSSFQLLAGTNRDLAAAVHEGRFREDLFARINLWTFQLPGLADRKEDIEPNLEYELGEWTRKCGQRITFNREARSAFLKFATSSEAAWLGNFRDFNAAIVRMATLAPSGRINKATVDAELVRLRQSWRVADESGSSSERALLTDVLSDTAVQKLDRFDKTQLADVIAACRESKNLSAAGRLLFSESRQKKAKPNDADRLRKYLARFGLDWDAVSL